jgi:hypothetical protein
MSNKRIHYDNSHANKKWVLRQKTLMVVDVDCGGKGRDGRMR